MAFLASTTIIRVLVLALAFLPSPALSYTWSFLQEPSQCKDLTIQISGSDGIPPYRLLIARHGSSPFANNTEIRRSFDVDFLSSESSVTFKMPYPANSQFVVVVSDASGFASGGTSVATVVSASDDSSCLDFSLPLNPFFFFMTPSNQVVQCGTVRFYWNAGDITGNVDFVGVIPGGQSFEIPQGLVSNIAGQGPGFEWTPSIKAGTTLIIICGDGRGVGKGGSVQNVVNGAPSFDTSCLNENSPSSTPGSPAGGVNPTQTSSGNVMGSGDVGRDPGATITAGPQLVGRSAMSDAKSSLTAIFGVCIILSIYQSL